jgi:uncharacterized membrane protein
MIEQILAHAGEAHLPSFQLPPLHPILVNFTAALIPSAFVADLMGRLLGRASLHVAAWWMLLFGTVITPLTVIAGWFWLRQMQDMGHDAMAIHQWLGTALTIVFAALAVWRWTFHRSARIPTVTYLGVACLVVAVLVYQGHLGGGMSFGSEAQPVMAGAVNADGTRVAPPDAHQHGHEPDRTSSTRSTTQPTAGDGWSDYIETR